MKMHVLPFLDFLYRYRFHLQVLLLLSKEIRKASKEDITGVDDDEEITGYEM